MTQNEEQQQHSTSGGGNIRNSLVADAHFGQNPKICIAEKLLYISHTMKAAADESTATFCISTTIVGSAAAGVRGTPVASFTAVAVVSY